MGRRRTTDHGSALYQRGCRCETCRAAKAAENRRYGQAHRAATRARAVATGGVVDGIAHGITGYTYHCCRCDVCRAANRAASAAKRAAAVARFRAGESGTFSHGLTGYAYGCRCERCKAVVSEYQRARYLRRTATAS